MAKKCEWWSLKWLKTVSDGGLIKTNLVWKLAETWKQASCGSFAFIIFLSESTFLLVGVLFVVTRDFWPGLDLSIIFHIHHFMGRRGSILFHLLRERWHTGLKTSDWSREITWPGYWPPDWSGGVTHGVKSVNALSWRLYVFRSTRTSRMS